MLDSKGYKSGLTWTILATEKSSQYVHLQLEEGYHPCHTYGRRLLMQKML